MEKMNVQTCRKGWIAGCCEKQISNKDQSWTSAHTLLTIVFSRYLQPHARAKAGAGQSTNQGQHGVLPAEQFCCNCRWPASSVQLTCYVPSKSDSSAATFVMRASSALRTGGHLASSSRCLPMKGGSFTASATRARQWATLGRRLATAIDCGQVFCHGTWLPAGLVASCIPSLQHGKSWHSLQICVPALSVLGLFLDVCMNVLTQQSLQITVAR